MSRVLFGLALLAAAALVLAVLTAPALDAGETAPHGWAAVVALFARDAALRRTSLASAAGLVVAACVFFQPVRRS
jgi:hypothetical protein